MTDPSSPFQDPARDARRERAKGRIYVLCQTVGWAGFLLLQLFFTHVIKSGQDKKISLSDDALIVMVCLLGWTISHFARRYIHKWEWKQMGWLKILPRGLLLTFTMSLIWTVVGFGWNHGVLREAFPDNINPFVWMSVSVVNGSFVFGAWISLYMVYHVFDRFNSSEIERLRLTAVVKDAELRALKSQVNPHFMFNSLNSVRALIDEDPARAREAVTQLANMLRYSLQAGRQQTVSFEDELTVVNDYLALEQVRHEERLRLRLDVAPETLRRSIPPMLLQTLVENAVKYGISTQTTGGEIAIVARIAGDNLRISVSNPGSLQTGSTAASKQSTGVGLRNASDRLQLLFGDSATLTLKQSGPAEVTAEVVVPQESTRPPSVPGKCPSRPAPITRSLESSDSVSA